MLSQNPLHRTVVRGDHLVDHIPLMRKMVQNIVRKSPQPLPQRYAVPGIRLQQGRGLMQLLRHIGKDHGNSVGPVPFRQRVRQGIVRSRLHPLQNGLIEPFSKRISLPVSGRGPIPGHGQNHKAVRVDAHVQRLPALHVPGASVPLHQINAAPILRPHETVADQKIPPCLCQPQKLLPLFPGKNPSFCDGKPGKHPHKPSLAPGVFVVTLKLLPRVVKAVHIPAVLPVLAPGQPERQDAVGQFIFIKALQAKQFIPVHFPLISRPQRSRTPRCPAPLRRLRGYPRQS